MKIFLKWLKPPNVQFVNYDMSYLEIFPKITCQEPIEINYFQETIHNVL